MSNCACNRWGPGTTKERPPNTESSKELEARIAEMTKQREKQDAIWTQTTGLTQTTNTKTNTNENIKNESFFMKSK